jgi:hypothetical protein
VAAADPLGRQRDPFVFEKLPHEGDVSLADLQLGALERKDVGAAEDFGLQPPSVAPEAHDLVDQQFHRVDAERGAGRFAIRLREHEVIHPADARHGVVEAGRDAGAEHGRH